MVATQLDVPNSIVLLMDARGGVLPNSLSEGPVTATASCVVICTQNGDETRVVLTDESAADEFVGLEPVFAGDIECPTGEISVFTTRLERILNLTAPPSPCSVKVWTNRLREPSKVVVLLVRPNA